VQKILISLVIFTTTLLAFELDFKKSFEATVQPDIAVTNINISVKGQSETEVTKRLQEVSIYINGYTQVKKEGGEFRVNANYYYQNGQRLQDGYIGSMRYKISSKEIDDLDIFLGDLMSQKKNETIEVSSYGYEVTKEKLNNSLEQLRLQAIVWGIAYAKDLSSKIYKKCELTNISFTQTTQPRMMATKMNAKLEDGFAPQPIRNEQTITLNPSYELECK